MRLEGVVAWSWTAKLLSLELAGARGLRRGLTFNGNCAIYIVAWMTSEGPEPSCYLPTL